MHQSSCTCYFLSALLLGYIYFGLLLVHLSFMAALEYVVPLRRLHAALLLADASMVWILRCFGATG